MKVGDLVQRDQPNTARDCQFGIIQAVSKTNGAQWIRLIGSTSWVSENGWHVLNAA
jgi:hypothetical protein